MNIYTTTNNHLSFVTTGKYTEIKQKQKEKEKEAEESDTGKYCIPH